MHSSPLTLKVKKTAPRDRDQFPWLAPEPLNQEEIERYRKTHVLPKAYPRHKTNSGKYWSTNKPIYRQTPRVKELTQQIILIDAKLASPERVLQMLDVYRTFDGYTPGLSSDLRQRPEGWDIYRYSAFESYDEGYTLVTKLQDLLQPGFAARLLPRRNLVDILHLLPYDWCTWRAAKKYIPSTTTLGWFEPEVFLKKGRQGYPKFTHHTKLQKADRMIGDFWRREEAETFLRVKVRVYSVDGGIIVWPEPFEGDYGYPEECNPYYDYDSWTPWERSAGNTMIMDVCLKDLGRASYDGESAISFDSFFRYWANKNNLQDFDTTDTDRTAKEQFIKWQAPESLPLRAGRGSPVKQCNCSPYLENSEFIEEPNGPGQCPKELREKKFSRHATESQTRELRTRTQRARAVTKGQGFSVPRKAAIQLLMNEIALEEGTYEEIEYSMDESEEFGDLREYFFNGENDVGSSAESLSSTEISPSDRDYCSWRENMDWLSQRGREVIDEPSEEMPRRMFTTMRNARSLGAKVAGNFEVILLRLLIGCICLSR